MNEICYSILYYILYDILHIMILYVVYFRYTTPPFVFHVTQDDPISSLMMAGYCRNM
jgi:hypothetical protein